MCDLTVRISKESRLELVECLGDCEDMLSSVSEIFNPENETIIQGQVKEGVYKLLNVITKQQKEIKDSLSTSDNLGSPLNVFLMSR